MVSTWSMYLEDNGHSFTHCSLGQLSCFPLNIFAPEIFFNQKSHLPFFLPISINLILRSTIKTPFSIKKTLFRKKYIVFRCIKVKSKITG
jgi:hypothetical protein